MSNVSDRVVGVMSSNLFLPLENQAVYELM